MKYAVFGRELKKLLECWPVKNMFAHICLEQSLLFSHLIFDGGPKITDTFAYFFLDNPNIHLLSLLICT